MNELRGVDNTGIASVSRNIINGQREIRIAKVEGPPYFLFDTKAFDRCFHGNNLLYIGHNRSRTVGGSDRKNAHPFLFNDIVGAHNGTIDFMNKNRLENGADFKTDSEAIFNNIQVHGIEETIGRIEKTEAYALVWYDRRDNSLNFLRNDKRPLVYVYSNDRKAIFWGSEYELLMASIHREPDMTKKVPEKVFLAPADTHLKWIIPDSELTALPDPLHSKYKNHIYQYASSRNKWHGGEVSGKKPENGTNKYSNFSGSFPIDNFDDEIEQGAWEGMGVACHVPEKARPLPEVLVEEAITKVSQEAEKEEVKESQRLLPTIVKSTTVASKVMTPLEFLQKSKLEHIKSSGVFTLKEQKMPLMYDSKDIQVYRNKDTGEWIQLRWNYNRSEWEKVVSKTPPAFIPYPILDINANHKFHHSGKEKRGTKKIAFKGWKGKLLEREAFEQLMTYGCLSCERKPEWGNNVVFLDPEHHFLCDFCALTPNLVDDLMRKQKDVA